MHDVLVKTNTHWLVAPISPRKVSESSSRKVLCMRQNYVESAICKRLQMFFIKKNKNAFLTFFILLAFFFQQVKVTQVTFPDSSNIGNVLTIKVNGI